MVKTNITSIATTSACLAMLCVLLLTQETYATDGVPSTEPDGDSLGPECMALYNAPWESLRLLFDYDPSFSGNAVITDPSIRTWIEDNMLFPARALI